MGILPNCKDPTLKALKSIGYNVVLLPRVDLRPTQLLVANDKRLSRLGEMATVFVQRPGAPPLPAIGPDRPGPNIAITKTAALDATVGLNILGGLISALGGSTLGLNLAFAKAAKIQMEYSGTKENAAEPAAIDQFLAGAGLNPFSKAAKDMLEADLVYVVTSTLKANKVNVTATDANKHAIGIDVPVLANAVGGSMKVTASSSTATTVTFEGEVPLAFAFQAIRLFFEDGAYRTFKPTAGGGLVAESVASPFETDLLLRG